MTSVNFQSAGGQISNQVFSHDQILTEINSVGSEFEPLVKLTSDQRLLLLLRFNWDIKSLRESFGKYTDMNHFLLLNGICPENIVTSIKESECTICCAEEEVSGLRCQHMACGNCWKDYLSTKIKSGHSILCCIGCSLSICNAALEKFLNDPKLLSSHQKLVIGSYVRADPSLAWCSKKCGKAIRRSTSDTVRCTCGSQFCFLCGSSSHLPATCHQMQLWKSPNWILGNTKECPNCWVPIEKREGCDHMFCTCCYYQFCWKCLQSLRTHRGNCETSKTNARQSRMKSRSDFLVFTEYHLRFKYHKQCLTSERQKLPALKSTTTLLECRQVLMNSCIFEYYLKYGEYSKSFEEHQKNLESAVEDLSKHLKKFRKCNRSVSIELAEKFRLYQQSFLDYCAKGGTHEDLEGRRGNTLFTILTIFAVNNFILLSILAILSSLFGFYVAFNLQNTSN